MKSQIFFTFQQSSHRRIFAQIPTIRIMQRGGKNGISIETDHFLKELKIPLPSVSKAAKYQRFFWPFFHACK